MPIYKCWSFFADGVRSKNTMARIIRSFWLSFLVVYLVSTNLMNSLEAQSGSPAPAPAIPSPAPTPEGPSPAPEGPAPAPEGPAPAPEGPATAPEGPAPAPEGPAPAPEGPAPAPERPAPAPAPTPKSPAPAPPPPGHTAPQPAPEGAPGGGGSSKLRGGQKAGIVIGVLFGAALIGFGGLVYKKRQSNIRRSNYTNATHELNL